jgi:hypothetical protein
MYDISFFDEELELIADRELKAVTKDALLAAPAWFWTAPASATGRHHPLDDNVEGGNCHHTAKVVWLAYKFALELQLDTDAQVSAAHLHDIAKFGLRNEAEQPPRMPSYAMHGEIAAAHLLEYKDLSWSAELIVKWYTVCNLVRTHMGKWGQAMPATLEQNVLHLADVAASCRAFVALKFTDPEAAPLLEEIAAEREYFTVDADGDLAFAFGHKYCGVKAEEVMRVNPGYFDWMLKQTFPAFVKRQVREIQERHREVSVT